MTTQIFQHNPARSDVPVTDQPDQPDRAAPRAGHSSRWALSGLVAGLAGIGTVVSTSLVDATTDASVRGDEHAVLARLSTETHPMLVFQVVSVLGALAMLVFAAGLQRRLRVGAPDGLAAPVAFAGLAGTAVVSVLGSGLNTEFISGVRGQGTVLPSNAAMYNHWVATIPWVWVLAGAAALAVFAASRQGVVPRWIGFVSLVLGGLSVVAGVAPIQYLAIVPASLWLVVVSLGLLLGDRQHRSPR